jgi:hypothetical protein
MHPWEKERFSDVLSTVMLYEAEEIGNDED